jgi:hypothetical protein
LNKTLPYAVGIIVYFVLFLLFILSSGPTLTTQFLKYRSFKVYETSFEYYSLSVNVHELTFHRKVSRYQRVINGTKNNKMEKKKRKRTRIQTMNYQTRQRNLKIVQHEHTKTNPKKPPKNQQTKRVNLGAPEGWAVPAPVVALVLLLLSAVATINNQILKSKNVAGMVIAV